jgi:hypothetical protein
MGSEGGMALGLRYHFVVYIVSCISHAEMKTWDYLMHNYAA